jgi:DNA-binding Xre family transcriptional regulator
VSQITTLCDTLKQLLKARNITYKDLAQALDLSEANIKRIFSSQSFTLERLEQICGLLELSLSDLFLLNTQKEHRLMQLTQEQEEELIADKKLLLVAVCARDGWSFNDMITHYQISEHECIRLLARLDKLKMLQLLPGNKYKQAFRFYMRGSYSAASAALIKNHLNQLTQEAAALNQADAKLPLDKRQHLGLLLAMRPWELKMFEAMKR